jgi:hypothetical protein
MIFNETKKYNIISWRFHYLQDNSRRDIMVGDKQKDMEFFRNSKDAFLNASYLCEIEMNNVAPDAFAMIDAQVEGLAIMLPKNYEMITKSEFEENIDFVKSQVSQNVQKIVEEAQNINRYAVISASRLDREKDELFNTLEIIKNSVM